MRIGRLLLERGLVDRDALAAAVAAQPASRMRLCSLLIERGAVAFDDASRALGEQLGSAAVLLRHLEGRDPALAARLPASIARNLVAVPVGRLASGALIVCVRDPGPSALATLTRVLGEAPVMAVAPARHVERLVRAVYRDEVDIPIDVDDDDVPIDIAIAEERPRPKPPRTISVVVPKLQTAPAPARDSLDATLAAFRDIDDPEWLFDVAMKYVAARWRSSLLLGLNDKRAVGVRGHGERVTPRVVKTFVVEIAETAVLELARTQRRVIDEPPDELGAEHAELAAVLGAAPCPVVAPITAGERVTHVLAVTESLDGDREGALVDLGMLAEAMSEALARM